ncbi:hypothetical protein [Epilithonimonas hominis]|uniref:hypothetical protein n=1 Tax=Epilithonimonas hominis TaxID=420404 RepID=UPI0028A03F34|nr:hypothetical protein [Epilithonimonas hominis]
MEKETTIKKEKSPLWKRVENFAESQPRKSFYIMFGLILFSVLFSIGNLIYIQKVSVPKYEKMKKENIFKDATNSLATPIRETEKIMDMREAMKELEYYRRKTALNGSDSIRIKYLLDKYQIKK